LQRQGNEEEWRQEAVAIRPQWRGMTIRAPSLRHA
jgi:hypothetical protein